MSLAPQAGPSQPTAGRHKSGAPSKRKALDEENEAGTNKRTKTIAPPSKAKTIKGEKKAGGLIINPILPPSNPPPLPSAVKSKGKGKERYVETPSQQDLEVDEDVRRMDEERERLRIRDVQTSAKSVEFKTPLLPKTPILRRPHTGLGATSTPDNVAVIDSTQPIPIRDTPTIDRNRAMRGEPVRRRSSMSMRGKRASSSFENTGVIPIPHPTVSTDNFHKHIDQELPEAHRTRHLLVWCTARTSAPSGRSLSKSSRAKNPKLPPLTAEGATLLHEVQKEIQKMLTEQRIDIILSSRMDEDGDNAKVKEHEQNAKNRKREDDFMRHIERCKQEDAAWSTAIQSYNARQASVVETLTRQQRSQNGVSTEWVSMDESDPLHDRELLGAQLARKCKETASRKRGRSPLGMRLVEVENKADRIHSSLHISDQLTKRATRHLNKRFEGLAAALASRSQPPTQQGEVSTLASLTSANPKAPSTSGAGAPPDTLSILRALVRTDMERPRQEVGDAAKRAAREVLRVNAGPGRSSTGGAGASERRLTAITTPTSRKAPGTPRRAGTPRQKSEGAEGGG